MLADYIIFVRPPKTEEYGTVAVFATCMETYETWFSLQINPTPLKSFPVSLKTPSPEGRNFLMFRPS
jgi:hypothetical protein